MAQDIQIYRERDPSELSRFPTCAHAALQVGIAMIVIGLLRETSPGERRVALIPADIQKLASRAAIRVERNAGAAAGFTNHAYVNAGARLGDVNEVLKSDLIIKVWPNNLFALRTGCILISLAGQDPMVAELAKARSLIHLVLERLPRRTGSQAMAELPSEASNLTADASRLFSDNVSALLNHLVDTSGNLTISGEDPILEALLAGQSLP